MLIQDQRENRQEQHDRQNRQCERRFLRQRRTDGVAALHDHVVALVCQLLDAADGSHHQQRVADLQRKLADVGAIAAPFAPQRNRCQTVLVAEVQVGQCLADHVGARRDDDLSQIDGVIVAGRTTVFAPRFQAQFAQRLDPLIASEHEQIIAHTDHLFGSGRQNGVMPAPDRQHGDAQARADLGIAQRATRQRRIGRHLIFPEPFFKVIRFVQAARQRPRTRL
jgi:hypothetical protein